MIESLDKEGPYYAWNLEETGVLPADWQFQISEVSRSTSKDTILSGESTTSREEIKGQRIIVSVVTGDDVKSKLPWLWSLYEGKFLQLAESALKKRLWISRDLVSAININRLSGRSAKYEWHVDSNPVTGLLFATSCSTTDGGRLVFQPTGSTAVCEVIPKAGMLLCFDARAIPHRVSPLRVDIDRISVPMNYYDSEDQQSRPIDLNEAIYNVLR